MCICLDSSRVEAKYDLVHNLESLLATKQDAKIHGEEHLENNIEVPGVFTLPRPRYSENEGSHKD